MIKIFFTRFGFYHFFKLLTRLPIYLLTHTSTHTTPSPTLKHTLTHRYIDFHGLLMFSLVLRSGLIADQFQTVCFSFSTIIESSGMLEVFIVIGNQLYFNQVSFSNTWSLDILNMTHVEAPVLNISGVWSTDLLSLLLGFIQIWNDTQQISRNGALQSDAEFIVINRIRFWGKRVLLLDRALNKGSSPHRQDDIINRILNPTESFMCSFHDRSE